MAHLHYAETASAVLVAPATAEMLSRLARGGASDLVSTSVLAVPRNASGKLKIPVFIAPAMHEAMWRHPATQASVKLLKSYGYQLIGPVSGPLGRADDSGEGRMAEPADIVKKVLSALGR
jgi:phosphopantothenoylcysteine decarboxylase/phosphopantothenate--cysteine ligase